MSPFLRKVRTASGAVAVQIVEKKHGQRRILEHLGSAHSEAELAALVEVGTRKLNAGREQLAAYAETLLPGTGGIGRYPAKGFVHVDVRKAKSRWAG